MPHAFTVLRTDRPEIQDPFVTMITDSKGLYDALNNELPQSDKKAKRVRYRKNQVQRLRATINEMKAQPIAKKVQSWLKQWQKKKCWAKAKTQTSFGTKAKQW